MKRQQLMLIKEPYSLTYYISPGSRSGGRETVSRVAGPDPGGESLTDDAPYPSAPQTGSHESALRCRKQL